MKALRILVVEDDAMIGGLLAETLEDLGHVVCAVETNAANAVAAAARHHPDLMIVDVGLGEASGIAAVKEILRSGFVPARLRDRRYVARHVAGPRSCAHPKAFPRVGPGAGDRAGAINGADFRPCRDMTHAALAPLIGPEFDQFLGAAIGEDRNGTTLSVLSALARLDVDPWREAASLARMSREAAAERLTALIDALPHEAASAIGSKASAADLVALLPKK